MPPRRQRSLSPGPLHRSTRPRWATPNDEQLTDPQYRSRSALGHNHSGDTENSALHLPRPFPLHLGEVRFETETPGHSPLVSVLILNSEEEGMWLLT
jgi:hypothetical protein